MIGNPYHGIVGPNEVDTARTSIDANAASGRELRFHGAFAGAIHFDVLPEDHGGRQK